MRPWVQSSALHTEKNLQCWKQKNKRQPIQTSKTSNKKHKQIKTKATKTKETIQILQIHILETEK
jgi:hypothetical protein